MSNGPPGINFECADPMLRVRDLWASVAFYEDVLGFTRADWATTGEHPVTSVNRQGAGIYLVQDDPGTGALVWVGAGDVDLLYAEYLASGAPITSPPTNHPWALEMEVTDLDGHVLRFGGTPR